MPELTIRVPGTHREDLRRHLIGLYAVVAEALVLATESYLRDGGPLEPLLGKRGELARLDQLVEQVSWPPANRRAVSVSGDAALIAESVQSLLRSTVSDLNDIFESGVEISAQVQTAQPVMRNAQSLHRILRQICSAEA